jgi:hypothetical protein
LPKPFAMKAAPLIISLLAVNSLLSCKVAIPKNKTVVTTPATSAAATIAMPGAAPVVTAPEPTAAPTPSTAATFVKEETLFRVPVGPALLIMPGEGVGPIRFGAKLSTVQRLMESDCTELTEVDGVQWCRYQAHAIDFGIENEKLAKIHVHGVEREFTPGKGLGIDNSYGIFRGAFANRAQLGMYEKFVDQGKPLRVEKVNPGRFPTVEKHYYENMVLEYDKLTNGNVVLGGVVLTKPSKPGKPASGAAEKKAGDKTAKKRTPKPVH